MMLLHFTIQQRTQPESSSMLREQILDLSKRYIKALAEENRNVVDGPYAGVMTAYGECGDMGMACSTGRASTFEGHVVLGFEDSLFS
ncbi:Alpha-1,6-mannosylglycoprotein 6-beta-N-acetylglucosaminyltransferase A [Lemmus lemmus]